MNPLLNEVSISFLHFREPWLLLLVLLLPLVYWWETRKREPSVLYPTLERVCNIRRSLKLRLFPLRVWMRLLVLLLLILGLARFQKGRKSIEVITHGVDIILAVDTSGSMKAEDFQIDSKRTKRLDAVKWVVSDFVRGRESDRLGMVVFGSMAFTQCPLTLDHGVFLTFLRNLEIGMAGEQTAIGSAIGTGVNRLKDLKSQSKVMILLTDGANTAGDMDPLQAAEIARAFGIKIYTIGVGAQGEAPFLVQTIFGPQYQYVQSDLNEDVLRKIADLTSGKYYRAQDTEQLQRIYAEIDALETTKAKLKEHMEFRELYSIFVIPALILLGLERVLDWTWFRRTP